MLYTLCLFNETIISNLKYQDARCVFFFKSYRCAFKVLDELFADFSQTPTKLNQNKKLELGISM